MGKSKFCLIRKLSTREKSRLASANLLGLFQGLSMVVVVSHEDEVGEKRQWWGRRCRRLLRNLLLGTVRF